MKRETWLIPFLSALYWGSCSTNDRLEWDGTHVQGAMCGFAASMILLLSLRQVMAWRRMADIHFQTLERAIHEKDEAKPVSSDAAGAP